MSALPAPALPWWHPERAAVESHRTLLAEATASDDADAPADDLVAGVFEAHAAGGVSASSAKRWMPVWCLFAAWCQREGVEALPADGRTVAAFLLARSNDGVAPATLQAEASAVRWAHSEGGHVGHLDRHPAITAMLKKLEALHGSPASQAPPLDLEGLGRVLRRDHRDLSHAVREAILVTSRQLRISISASARARVQRVDDVIEVTPGLEKHETVTLAIRGLPHYTAFGPGHVLDAGSQLAGVLALVCQEEVECLARLTSDRDPKHQAAKIADIVGLRGAQVWDEPDDRAAKRILRSHDHAFAIRLRDDCALCLMWAAALRSDEMVAAKARNWLEAERREEGVAFFIDRSKTDQTSVGATAVVPHGREDEFDLAGPVDRWVAYAQLGPDDPLFPNMQHRYLDEELLHCTTIAPLVQMLESAGAAVDVEERLRGHSPRRGWAVEATRQGVPLPERMAHMRHSTLDGHQGYCGGHVRGETHVPDTVLDAVIGQMPASDDD